MTTPADQNAGAEGASKDFLSMSDDDFLKENSPSAPVVETVETPAAATAEAGQDTVTGSEAVVETPADETQEVEKTNAADGSAGAGTDNAGGDDKTKTVETPAEKVVVDGKGKVEAKADPAAKPAEAAEPGKEKPAPAEAAKPVDYEAFYKQILTPFKANGRTIELKTPEEAIRLMQMGAGYGRKIQDLQPHLKTIRMLEKNNLLDDDRLSLLIDINNKNPEAIKKIIKESGIDPLDLNIGDNVDYKPKNHAVSDKEMAFQSALDDVKTHPDGNSMLRDINQTWDQESKSALFESPSLFGIIQSQRETGIYDQIVAEIDRQKLLGKIHQSTSFLQAYKAAGDHLQATNGFKLPQAQVAQIQNQTGDTQQPQVIATKAAAPKAQVQNGDKAAAAAPTKTTSVRKAGITVNPLQMADDDFLKQFSGRL